MEYQALGERCLKSSYHQLWVTKDSGESARSTTGSSGLTGKCIAKSFPLSIHPRVRACPPWFYFMSLSVWFRNSLLNFVVAHETRSAMFGRFAQGFRAFDDVKLRRP